MFEVGKIGIHLALNMFLTALPLSVSEAIMTALNPAMRKRNRVRSYDSSKYKTIDWDENETKNLALRLKKARDERNSTGKFSVFIGDSADTAERPSAPLGV